MEVTIHEDLSLKLDYALLFDEIAKLLGDSDTEIHLRYQSLYQILVDVLCERTRMYNIDFSGPFAMLSHLCDETGYRSSNRAGAYAVQRFRAICSKKERLESRSVEELLLHFAHHAKAVADFISAVCRVKLPGKLSGLLPPEYISSEDPTMLDDVLKVMVSHFDDAYVYVYPEWGDGDELKVSLSYVRDRELVDFSYLRERIKRGTQLNLVRPMMIDGAVCAELIILEPDFLVDVTSVASCFEVYGTTPLAYVMGKITPRENTRSILLGNFAGQMLDEAVYNHDCGLPAYKDSALAFFRNNALALSASKDVDETFHEEAVNQRENIWRMVHERFPADKNIDIRKIVLEPSFFSNVLGIQGRMDLLQIDKRVLMEQKSGKKDEYRNTHRQPHYVQMLLYLALLHYGLGRPNSSVSSFLLYSKYPDGLIKEAANPSLLRLAFHLRNDIVALEYLFSHGRGRELYERLTVDDFNVNQLDNKLWNVWVKPRISSLLASLHSADSLSKDYYYRFLTFVSREHLLAKIGSPNREASGFASLWNANEQEKKDAGTILSGLRLSYSISGNGAIETVTLTRTDTDDLYLPNFRVGDIVVFYPYVQGTEPDVCRDMVFRSSILSIDNDKVELKLRNPQKNALAFATDERFFWAMEPDLIESSFSALYRSLQSLLTAPSAVRDLILARTKPGVDESVTINGSYGENGEFDDLVLCSKQAQDFFLLVGPPGTGKTSCGLVNMLKEALTEADANVLLLAYTNRAVDEICLKLRKEELDFIRIGTNHSCPEAYLSNLLCNKAESCVNVGEIKKMISSTRIFVSTTAAMASNEPLLQLKTFSLAIVDEASQILEPHILGLICAQNENGRSIRKFVFIGDHKQLPAVVLQPKEESEVKEETLRSIGLTNCANSIFERLISLYGDNPRIVYRFVRQARMHADVAAFPNMEFYRGELDTLLPWQVKKNTGLSTAGNDWLKNVVASHRFAFFSVDSPLYSRSAKTNEAEAKLIAELARSIYELHGENGLIFDPDTSLGIIVPFRQQIAEVRRALSLTGIVALSSVMIDTVERYQGSERDYVIYGFTVKDAKQLNFLSGNVVRDGESLIDRKLNVALTRARKCMIAMGDERVLRQDVIFSHLIEYSKKCGGYYKVAAGQK